MEKLIIYIFSPPCFSRWLASPTVAQMGTRKICDRTSWWVLFLFFSPFLSLSLPPSPSRPFPFLYLPLLPSTFPFFPLPLDVSTQALRLLNMLFDSSNSGCLQAHRCKNLPTPLEYFGFIYFFPTFLAGPPIEIATYLKWAEGNLFPAKVSIIRLSIFIGTRHPPRSYSDTVYSTPLIFSFFSSF